MREHQLVQEFKSIYTVHRKKRSAQSNKNSRDKHWSEQIPEKAVV